MKKFFLIFVGMALVVGVLATAGFVYAATEDPPETETSEGNDRPIPRVFKGKKGGPMFWFPGWGKGILSDYMFPAMADAFDLSEDQVAAFEKVRETMQGIRDEFSLDEIQAKMKEAFSSAASDALENEAISQDQYDQMFERMEQMGRREFGPMGGRGMSGGFGMDGFSERNGGMILEYVDSTLAAALDLSLEELQTLKAEGFNMNDYAVENDLTVEELQNLMKGVHANAIQAAFDDGEISKDQYEMMMERLENYDGRLPFGPGFKGSRRPGW